VRPQRIASLAPSQTDWILALGAGERLRAVTRYCEVPADREWTRLQGWSNLKAAEVLALDADLILTSSLCQAGLVDALKRAGAALLHQDPRRLGEVRSCLLELGAALGLESEAAALALRWDEGWAALEARAPAGLERPRVFIEEWHQPPMAAGNWVPDLVRAAGGEAFLTAPGSHSLEVSWEEVMEFDPQIVVLSLCGIGLSQAPEQWMKMEGWDRVEAARTGRVFSVDDSLFNRPSLALLEGGRLLQQLIGEALWGWPPCRDARLRRLEPKA
jgi:iron complex transport system substrate-binding protein